MIGGQLFAQNQAAIWNWNYKISLDFRGGLPVCSEFDKMGYNTEEEAKLIAGSGASYTDKNGNLLLYVSKNRLFNGNGDSLLNGNNEMFDSNKFHDERLDKSIIIKDISQYSFTVIYANQNGYDFSAGIQYSKVDLSEYPGKVVSKNNQIYRPKYAGLGDFGFAAYTHPSKEFTWLVVADFEGQLSIYKVTNDTIILHSTYIQETIGGGGKNSCQLNFSNFGNYLGRVIYTNEFQIDKTRTYLIVYKFNKYTGKIEAVKSVLSKYSRTSNAFEFSPNEKYMYYGCQTRNVGDTARILQMSNPFLYDNDTICRDVFVLPYESASTLGAPVQLGPDGRIYMTNGSTVKDSFLSYIPYPNLRAPNCGFVLNGIKTKNEIATVGMPNFVQDYITQPYFLFDTVCLGETTNIALVNNYTDSVRYFIDGLDLGLLKSDTLAIRFTESGKHTIKTIMYYPLNIDTLVANIFVSDIATPNLGNDTMLCFNELLELAIDTNQVEKIRWSNNVELATYTVKAPGLIWVKVSNAFCAKSDTILVEALNCKITTDSLCLGQLTSHKLEDPTADSILWYIENKKEQIGNTVINHLYSQEGKQIIALKAYKSGLPKYVKDSFTITAMPNYFLKDSMFVCEPITLESPLKTEYTTQWNNIPNSQEVFAQKSGWYTLQITKNGCKSSDSTFVKISDCQCLIYYPSAFSPNNDGLNDVFSINTECDVSEVKFDIYNRWGENIVRQAKSWNGNYMNSPCQEGVYLWQLSFKDNKGIETFKTGIVHLVR